MRFRFLIVSTLIAILGLALPATTNAKKKKDPGPEKPWVTPVLPGGKEVVTDTSEDFLKAPPTLDPSVKVAKAAPTVDFAYYPGQTYRAEIWSTWGDSLCANGKYYASLGDHMHVSKEYPSSPGHHGAAYVYEYDPEAKTFRLLMDTSKVLKDVPEGDYVPGKIHSRLDLGKDGWLYCGTHRGSERATNDKYHYKGDWILRCNPKDGKAEVVVQAPVPKHCIPNSSLDAQRMIFYGGTAAGSKGDSDESADAIMFFAYDVANHKLLYSGNNGPSRGMFLSKTTGKVYYTPKMALAPIMCYDPSKPSQPPKQIPGAIGNRCATRETPNGMIFTASKGDSHIYSFDTKTEKAEMLAPCRIGPGSDYVAAMEADPTGRYVYYTLGAHGGTGAAIVQFDTKTKQKKIIAFLSPFIDKKYGVKPAGSFSISVDEKGETVFVTWNCAREGVNKAWDTVGLAAVHIPASERPL